MNRELAASHALSLYGARAEALLEPRKCQGWDLHTQPGTLSRINASTAARDPVCWLGSEARVHSDVRCHMWQLKSRTVLVVAAFLGASCGGGMSAGPTAPTAAPDQRLAASVAQPVPSAVRPSAGPSGISFGSVGPPSGRQQGEKLSDRIRGPLPRSIPHGHPAGSGPHRSIRFQADGGTR